jgi:hypothetical protein
LSTHDEHCANCNCKLGSHAFVSDDGQRLLCGRCFGASPERGIDRYKPKLRRGARR